jgi:hypothetical protein
VRSDNSREPAALFGSSLVDQRLGRRSAVGDLPRLRVARYQSGHSPPEGEF